MKNKKVVLSLLLLLLGLKFAYIPWLSWGEERVANIERLQLMQAKQERLIQKKSDLLTHANTLSELKNSFVSQLPETKNGSTSSTLWLNLVKSIKVDGVKVYNQKVQLESLVLDNVGYVVGSFYISGKAHDVMALVSSLEQKQPYVFFEKIKLTRPKQKEKLTVHLYLGYWFKVLGDVAS